MNVVVFLSLAVLVAGVLTIWADYAGIRRWLYLFKPLTMGFILLLVWVAGREMPALYQRAVFVGLLFSLVGDVFLMLPKNYFLAGLFSFLLAHLSYIIAFTSVAGFQWTWLPFIGLFGYGSVVIGLLWNYFGTMKLPALFYMISLLVMAWQAWGLWSGAGVVSAGIAATLFVISDTLLSFNRFRQKFHLAQLFILTTYFAAQWLIALSV